MVAPHPELNRRLRNTDNIVKSNKFELAPTLHVKYPLDYVDVNTHNTMQRVRPWTDIVSPLRFQTQIQSQTETFGIMGREIPHETYERWERQKKYGFTSLQNPIISPEEHDRRERDTKYGFASLQPISVDKILILCVDFPDKPHQISVETIYNRFFSDISNSLKNYYKEVSYGRYIPKGEAYGWYRAPNPSTYYSNKENGFGKYPQSAEKLVEDVIELAQNDKSAPIDWESFDTNDNGYVDNLIIVHSGAEAAYTGNLDDLWAHVYVIPTPKVVQNRNVWVYEMVSEYLETPDDAPTVGIDSHEFGHLLGLPDLYDFSGNSNGVGFYSLMGAGSWGGKGAIPVHMDAWSKYVLGFADATVNPIGRTRLTDIETNSEIIKYTTPDPKEYFLIENRQKLLYDSSLPSDGMLIWHINENQQYNDNEECYMVGLLQADGLKDLENKANYGDLGDPYPGILSNRSFGIDTDPGSKLCDGSKQKLLISNISDSSDVMTFDSTLQ